MGVWVSVTRSADPALLEYQLDELRNPDGAMGVVHLVRLRVEIRNVSDAQSLTASSKGYGLTLAFVQERGMASGFKTVFARLKRDWELDVPLG